jgi:hypothetical protein
MALNMKNRISGYSSLEKATDMKSIIVHQNRGFVGKDRPQIRRKKEQ